MIVPRQIYKYISNKLQLMSVPVFRYVSAWHYRFEGKEKDGYAFNHLNMKAIFQDTFENLYRFKLWYLIFSVKRFE